MAVCVFLYLNYSFPFFIQRLFVFFIVSNLLFVFLNIIIIGLIIDFVMLLQEVLYSFSCMG